MVKHTVVWMYLQPHNGNGVFPQCLPLSLTTLRDKHCQHPFALMGVVDTLGCYVVKFPKIRRCQYYCPLLCQAPLAPVLTQTLLIMLTIKPQFYKSLEPCISSQWIINRIVVKGASFESVVSNWCEQDANSCFKESLLTILLIGSTD